MEVSKRDQEILKSLGYTDKDMKQIVEAMSKTVFTVFGSRKERSISNEKVREILGDELYLDGLSRSAFHMSSMREKDGQKVYFDSMNLFRNNSDGRSTTKILSNKVKCLKCGDIIESKSRHDFKWCTCENVAVDGGLDYLKRCCRTEEFEELSVTTDDNSKE